MRCVSAAAQSDGGGEVTRGKRASRYGPGLVVAVGGENRAVELMMGSVVVDAEELVTWREEVVWVGEREKHVIGEENAILELEWGGVGGGWKKRRRVKRGRRRRMVMVRGGEEEEEEEEGEVEKE